MAGALLATAAAVTAVVSALSSYSPWPRLVAVGVSAGAKASAPFPLPVKAVSVAYCRTGPSWRLARPGFGCLNVTAVGFGACGDPPYGFTYTAANNTLHVGGCSWVLPAIEGGGILRLTTYLPLCREGSDFRPEAVAGSYLWGGMQLQVVAVLIYC